MSQDIFLEGTLTVVQFRQCKLPKNKKSQVLKYDKIDIYSTHPDPITNSEKTNPDFFF